MRRRELLASGGSSSLATALIKLCTEHAPQLMRSQHGSDILVEICRGGEGGLLEECLGEAGLLGTAHDALVAAVVGSSADAAEGSKEEGMLAQLQDPALTHFFGSRALRRLVLASSATDASGAAAASFASKLWHGALQGRCHDWVDTHAAKVLAALLQCGDEEVKQAATQELKALVPGSLEEWAAQLLGSGGGSKSKKRGRQAHGAPQQVYCATIPVKMTV